MHRVGLAGCERTKICERTMSDPVDLAVLNSTIGTSPRRASNSRKGASNPAEQTVRTRWLLEFGGFTRSSQYSRGPTVSGGNRVPASHRTQP